MSRRVLFVGHSAVRAGAQMSLLNFATWAKANAQFDFDILLASGGELVPDYERLASTQVLRTAGTSSRRLGRIARRLRPARSGTFDASTYDLVYANSITTGHVLAGLVNLRCPVVTHVRELDYWIERSGPENLELVKELTTHYIAVSHAVKANLSRNHGIPDRAIDVVHVFIPVREIEARLESRSAVRSRLGIPDDAVVVGGCGVEHWRKGLDLFLRVAFESLRAGRDRKLHFLWLGSGAKENDFDRMLFDARRAGLAESLTLVPRTDNPWEYYAAFDIFAMTSRDDPFPRVNLEAALFGSPILCYDNSGGSPEFVEHDAGYVVPYYDARAMAEKIVVLARDAELRKSLGARARQKVIERHDVPVGSRKILQVFDRLLAAQPSGRVGTGLVDSGQ